MKEPALIGIATLMRRAFQGDNLKTTARELLDRMRDNPNDANASMDLSKVLELGGNSSLAMEFQETALSLRQLYREKQPSYPRALKVLSIKSCGVIMDNMPLEFLLEHSAVQLESLYVGQGIQAPSQIPEHDVAIVAICESDRNPQLLADLASITDMWSRPILNEPSRIANLSRERLGELVQNIDGLVFSPSTRIQRHELKSIAVHQQPPNFRLRSKGWIIRPINSHAGHGLERFTTQQTLENYLVKTPGDAFLVAPFIPYASADGVYRKYRIALIQGESYPVHMALSQRWMVHYLNADMLENSSHRNEEAEFFERYDLGFGLKHRRALQNVFANIDLDYVVLDCAETRDGELLLFEADNGAVVHSMDPVDLFAYKGPAMRRIFDAFLNLLESQLNQVESQMVA